MKKLYFLSIAFAIHAFCFAQEPKITEIHYDNSGGDIDEGVEITGIGGTDLSDYSIVFYNGSNNSSYETKTLTSITLPGTAPDLGAVWVPVSGIQNGAPDGLALVKSGVVLEFLSYEGTITAIDGPAIGMTSVDIGVSQSSSTPSDHTLQLSDTGWAGPLFNSKGAINSNLSTLSIVKNQIEGFKMYPNPTTNGSFSISSKDNFSKKVEIYSIVGQQVLSTTVKNQENIDISNLIKGLYLVKIEENGKIASRKLVIN